MLYLELFLSFAQIGLLSVGGGYAAVPLIQRQAVEARQWLTMAQFADITAIAEMTPGPIALNAATFVGMQTAGIGGALTATLGCVLPTCALVMLLACVYSRYREMRFVQGALRGLRPAATAAIASAGLSILLLALSGSRAGGGAFRPQGALIFAASLTALRKTKLHPVCVMAAAGAAGALLYGVG